MGIRIYFFCIVFLATGNVLARSVPTGLRVDKRTAPLGVTMEQLRFEWVVQANQRGTMQTAWQIKLAASEEGLEKQDALLWDPGKVLSDKQHFIAYGGAPLSSGRRYFWKVRVWDQSGNASNWSETASFVTGITRASEWGDAEWIAYEALPDTLKVLPGVHGGGDYLGTKAVKRAVVPLFRKSFTISKPIAEAYLFISGLGHYEAYLNGAQASDDFLAPGWTAYEKRCLYNTYDVKDKLQPGENVIGAIVGTGFRYINRERYRKLVRAEAYPMLRAKLLIRYDDGSIETVSTDGTWHADRSPITFSSIYGGEDYDARQEQAGWHTAGFDFSHWRRVVLVDGPQGEMSPQTDYPLKVMEVFKAQQTTCVGKDSLLVDFGQNASGIIRLEVSGHKGDRVRVVPVEVLDDNGLPYQKASGDPYYFEYVLRGGEEEHWQPSFTYYGFRYALVTIESAAPVEEGNMRLTMLHTRNSAPEVGTFTCSNPLFNRINELIRWGIKSNLASVATDCPHREKLGWLEQTHLIGASMRYNFDIYNLYHKIVDDMIAGQLDNGLVPDIVPEYVPFEGGFRDSPEWGSASIIIPWYLYQWYGDRSVLERAYPMMTRYMKYLQTKSENDLLNHGLGDWFDLGPDNPGVSQLTPIGLTASAIYFYDAKLLAQVASLLGHEGDSKRYRELADRIKQAFNATYFNAETAVYATGSQTSFAMPLHMGMVDGEVRQRVTDNLIDSIIRNNRALTAGDIGYRYLLRALEDAGADQLIYEMNNRDDVPGYGYQIRNGATALTESWAALKYVSNNHMMLGHLMEWFYSGLLGIQSTTDGVAFKRITIRPAIIAGMDSASGSYKSPYGPIGVAWEKRKRVLAIRVEIPSNTRAVVYLPRFGNGPVKEGGIDVLRHRDIEVINGQKDGHMLLNIGSGRYVFEME